MRRVYVLASIYIYVQKFKWAGTSTRPARVRVIYHVCMQIKRTRIRERTRARPAAEGDIYICMYMHIIY